MEKTDEMKNNNIQVATLWHAAMIGHFESIMVITRGVFSEKVIGTIFYLTMPAIY